MKKIANVLAGLAMGLAMNAFAHGEARPAHGGIVQVASDIQYELVPQPTGAALYIVDHGKPADVAGMGGKLTVLNGTRKSQAELRPAGGNKLEAAGLKLAPGAKVVASVRAADGKATTVRFALE